MNKKKILFIEDDPNLLKNVKEILEEEGFIVKTEIEGESGLKSAFEWNPDIIICDIAIPLKNGYEILQEIAKNQETKSVPFIFLTAKVGKEDLRKGMQLGADDYIFKPFDINDLLNSIHLRLEKASQRKPENVQESFDKKYQMDDKISLRSGNSMGLYTIKDLKFLCARNPYILLKFSNGKSSLLRQSLDEWEEKLPSKYFIRIHRSTIVNTEFITRIEKLSQSSYAIRIKDESDSFVISKRYTSKVMSHFA